MKKDFDVFSALWALAVNALIILLLYLLGMRMPQRMGESGVPVMMGNVSELDADYNYTPVSSMPAPAQASAPETLPDQTDDTPAITQELEQTVAIDEGRKKTEKPVTVPTELTPEEIKARELQQRQEQAQQIDNTLQGLFANSRGMQASTLESESGADVQAPGSPTGNSTTGKLTGQGAYGTWDLGGRDMIGQLPKPVYEGINEEGVVVVTITVNPKGQVIDATINKRTNTSRLELREAAMKAARQTRFSETGSLDNQTGTITYYFKLK